MTAQARLSQWFTMESERGGGRGGGESWHVYRCIASATYWCRRSWVAHPCQERTWFLQTGCKFFSPLDSLFSSVVFKWLLSAVVSSLQLMYFFWVFQHPGTPSCRILVFYFFGLSSHLLPVSVGVSCVLLWEIKHSIHVMSFVFPRAVNVHAFLSSLLSPLHFVITKSIWFELVWVTQCWINRWWLRVRTYSTGRACSSWNEMVLLHIVFTYLLLKGLLESLLFSVL